MRKIDPTFIFLLCFFSLVIVFAFSFVILKDPMHDYVFYMEQWQTVLSGMNPWSNDTNTYGPLHSYLAYVYQIHMNLPRILFCALYFITSIYISLRIYKNALIDETNKNILYAMLYLNPLFWVFGLKYGINDFMMVFFVIFGITFYKYKHDLLAGTFFTLAISIKFIPIVMLPFLIFYRTQRIRVRYTFALSYIITSLFIFGISYLKWGNMMLYPLIHNTERRSKILSIFRFYRGDVSPLRLFTDNPNIDWLSIYFCIISLVIFYLVSLKYRFNNILSSITAIILLLTFYKVGHIQFYITPILLLILWISVDYSKIVETPFMLTSAYLLIIWISFVSFLYLLTSEYSQTAWREILGVPSFLIFAFLIIMLIIHQYKNRIVVNKSSDSYKDSS